MANDIFTIEEAKWSHENNVSRFTLHVKVSKWLEGWVYGYVEMGNFHLRIERLSPMQAPDASAILAVIANKEDWLIQEINRATTFDN